MKRSAPSAGKPNAESTQEGASLKAQWAEDAVVMEAHAVRWEGEVRSALSQIAYAKRFVTDTAAGEWRRFGRFDMALYECSEYTQAIAQRVAQFRSEQTTALRLADLAAGFELTNICTLGVQQQYTAQLRAIETLVAEVETQLERLKAMDLEHICKVAAINEDRQDDQAPPQQQTEELPEAKRVQDPALRRYVTTSLRSTLLPDYEAPMESSDALHKALLQYRMLCFLETEVEGGGGEGGAAVHAQRACAVADYARDLEKAAGAVLAQDAVADTALAVQQHLVGVSYRSLEAATNRREGRE